MLPKAAELVAVISYPTFLVLQGLFFAGYGLKEIVWDGWISPPPAPAAMAHHAAMRTFHQIELIFPIAHGLLFLSTGAAGALAALSQKNVVSLFESGFSLLKNIEMYSFLSACFLALLFNVKAYQMAHHDPATENMKKKSAVMGIISCFNYLLWGALSIMGAAASFAFVFCLVGLCSGGLKILYDFLYS